MWRKQNTPWFFIAISFLFFAALPAPVLHARGLYVYDLDSLVHLCTDMVEGEITRSYKAHNLDLIEIKVTHLHKGDFTNGQTAVVAHTDYYCKPKQGDWNPQPLAVGDRLALFLVRVETNHVYRIPEDAVIYMPLPGGIKLVQGDYLFGFSQRNNPGSYVANVPSNYAKAKLLTVARFREEVCESLHNTKEWARLLEAKQDFLDVPRLLKLLADRSKQTLNGRDYFTERVCTRFAESHDCELLSRALLLAKGSHEVWILQHGFGTPEGREYLLAKVVNAKVPMPARLRYADALRWVGVGEADESNSAYQTRIAKAAHANRENEELCLRLICCLGKPGPVIVQNEQAPLTVDWRGAFAVLKDLYEAKPSEEIRFAIEMATVSDREAYEKLKSPCGTFISILRPVDPDKYTKPKERSLIFEYEYTAVQLSRDTEVQPQVILIHQGTQKRYVFSTQLRILGGSNGGGSNSIVLPKNLPAGRYCVLFQIGDGDKAISTGHYFSADL